jgi:hypothetical protein
MLAGPRTRRRSALAVGAALSSLALIGCGQEVSPAAGEPGSTASPARTEVGGTRLGVSYAGGVMVLDAGTLELVGDLPREGFLRLNPAGDERHLMVSTGDAFEVLDTGVEVRVHRGLLPRPGGRPRRQPRRHDGPVQRRHGNRPARPGRHRRRG